MKEYKVYCLDRDGRNVEAQSIAAATDEEAIRQAKAMPGLRQCEVWRGHQLLARITEFDQVSAIDPCSFPGAARSGRTG